MDTVRRQQLGEVTRLSRDMLEAARQQAWDKVAELEASRKPLVIAFFDQPVAEQDTAVVKDVIEEILNLDQQVAGLTGQCQTELGSEIHTHKRRQAATNAYLSHRG